MCFLQKHMVGQQANGGVQEVTSSTATVYLQKESSLDIRSQVHCLNRHLTLCSSRTIPPGIIVAFSTIPPLHQFPLAEKKGNTLVSTFSCFCPAPFHFAHELRNEVAVELMAE
jgi:hypothetical protein